MGGEGQGGEGGKLRVGESWEGKKERGEWRIDQSLPWFWVSWCCCGERVSLSSLRACNEKEGIYPMLAAYLIHVNHHIKYVYKRLHSERGKECR